MMDAGVHERFFRAMVKVGAASRDDLLDVVAHAVREVTEARLVFVAVGPKAWENPVWWRCAGGDSAELPSVLARLSSTIVQAAVTDGRTVLTTNAADDARFSGSESVRRNAIEQVVCAPIGRVGVIYVQGGRQGVPFGPGDVRLVEVLAAGVRPMAEAWHAEARWTARPGSPSTLLRAPEVRGRSAAFAEALDRVARAAPTRARVLFTGPTGAGKSMLARVLHDHSKCAGGPFVEVNCSLLRDDRAAADLFGARQGAWTGSVSAQEGFVESADGGTLLLDEVGAMPSGVQAQLLGFAESGTYRRLGETRTRRVDVRIVSATCDSLRRESFREDLYWRLNEFEVRLPPLRERRDDIAEIATGLLVRVTRELDVPALGLSPSALTWLEDADWPGNVRQLLGAVRAGAIYAIGEDAAAIDAGHLARGLGHASGEVAGPPVDLRSAMRACKRRHVRRILEACNWNRTRAAEALGVTRTYVSELLREVSTEPDGVGGDLSENVDTDRTGQT